MPVTDEALALAPAWRQAAWLAHGAVSARRLVALFLERIAARDGALLAFATVTAEAALARAEALDVRLAREGKPVGPLHGLPYGMKDLVDTAGVVTDWGAEPYRGRVPDEDAHVTTLLREAGAVLLGKTAVGALAYGDLWYGGRTRNPWDEAEGSSGSSAGSASAVAAGLCAFAIGTETYGSIVSPAARCRGVGLRPTFGRVSRRGVMTLCPSLDKVGVLARAPLDAALVMGAIVGHDAADPAQIARPFPLPPVLAEGTRIGWRGGEIAPDILGEIERRAAASGAVLVELAPRPALPWEALVSILEGGSGRLVRRPHRERPRRPARLAGRAGLAQHVPARALAVGGGPRAARPAAAAGDAARGGRHGRGGRVRLVVRRGPVAAARQLHRASMPGPAGVRGGGRAIGVAARAAVRRGAAARPRDRPYQRVMPGSTSLAASVTAPQPTVYQTAM